MTGGNMRTYTDTELKNNRSYIEALSRQYPSVSAAAAEIINLNAILDLPKGTEYFLSDIHGEYESFRHILNNASGTIREKIDTIFTNSLTSEQRAELATLVYYPKEKIKSARQSGTDMNEWYRINLLRLIAVCRLISTKYTRSKVRKALPADYAYILEELLLEGSEAVDNRAAYYDNILKTVIELDRADSFIIALCGTVKRLAVDRLHIVGDVFDRGARPDIVLDDLMRHHCADIQWGNHDILWMGAASGSRACIACALNNAFTYGNLDTVEIGYGISLRPLALFAADVYKGRTSECFFPRHSPGDAPYDPESAELIAAMHKAIAIIQFKLEGSLIKRNPEYGMDDRLLLDKIRGGFVETTGGLLELSDKDFPTVDPSDPYSLTDAERKVIEQLRTAFLQSEKLQRHTEFLFSKGSIYKCYNGNLLLHGCIPMNEDGSFRTLTVDGRKVSGRALLDALERQVRMGYFAPVDSEMRTKGCDRMWFLWCGSHSPLFGRKSIKTFERLLVKDKSASAEERDPYYHSYTDEKYCNAILREFGLNAAHSHIVNGHIPVIRKKGESPVKANGRLIVIDGGFCRAYREKTGSAGYTLVYNSWGMKIIAHEPFSGIADAVNGNKDILSTATVFDTAANRIRVRDTDEGKKIEGQIEGLTMLLYSYRSGFINEKNH